MSRPLCRWCGSKLRLARASLTVGTNLKGRSGDYGDGLFCGLRCGYAWACKALDVNPQTFAGSACHGIKSPGEPR